MHLNLQEVDRIIVSALNEDIGRVYITANLLIPPQAEATGQVVSREAHVVCGLPVIQRLIGRMGEHLKAEFSVQEGAEVSSGDTLITLQGNARQMLAVERVLLNVLQRMSGVATLTRQYVKAVEGTNAFILDTRKTMPGLRELDKYATTVGGARNHRLRLDDGILIKDNHILLAGEVKTAVERARKGAPALIRIEVECDTPEQVMEAVEAKADVIMLDNMSPETMRKVVEAVKGKVPLEASGGVTLETVKAIAETGVDFISVGAITHSVPAVDIGLDLQIRQ